MQLLVINTIAGRLDRLQAVLHHAQAEGIGAIAVLGNLVAAPALAASTPPDLLWEQTAHGSQGYHDVFHILGLLGVPVYVLPGPHDESFDLMRTVLHDYNGPGHIALLHRAAAPLLPTDVIAGFGGQITMHDPPTAMIHFPGWEARLAFEHLHDHSTAFQIGVRRVFLFATPPRGAHIDRTDHGYVGVEQINGLIRTYQPQLVCCGGPGTVPGIEQIEGATVVNPGAVTDGDYALVDLPSLQVQLAHVPVLPERAPTFLHSLGSLSVLRSLLVPLDGSAWSEQALPVATMIAKSCGAQVHLAHVHVPFVGAYVEGVQVIDPEVDHAVRTNDAAYLAVVQRRLADDGCSTQVTLCDGSVAPALTDVATEVQADLVVMTTHGRGGLARMWLGSVADDLVRRSSTPVLLLRPQPSGDDTMAVPSMRHILVPLDGSSAAERVLPAALALSRMAHGRLTLLHVVDALVLASAPFTLRLAQLEDDVVAQRQHAAEQYLQSVQAYLRREGAEVRISIITNDQPATTILDLAKAHHADLLAMTTHGHGGLQRLLLGSVADEIMRGTTLPVLLYRPPTQAEHDKPYQTPRYSAHPAAPTTDDRLVAL